MSVRRGEIYLAQLRGNGKHVQTGLRPVLVVSNDISNGMAEIATVLPITTATGHENLPTHVPIRGFGLDKESTVLAEQITTLGTGKLKSNYYIGFVSDPKLMNKIVDAIGSLVR